MGCMWSSLNVPGTDNPLSHSLLGLEEFPFPLLALWGNKNWPPSMKRRGIQRNFMGIHKICGQVDSLLILPLNLFATEQNAPRPAEYEMLAL